MAAMLFPGAVRRPRVGGTYALTADDVVWGAERRVGNRVIKNGSTLLGDAPVYIEVKKHKASAMAAEYWRSRSKYAQTSADELILVTHVLRSKRLLVTMSDRLFARLLLRLDYADKLEAEDGDA
jgi:hypothetical protein